MSIILQSLSRFSAKSATRGLLPHDIVWFKMLGRSGGRGNPDWQTRGIGHPEIDKKTGLPVPDASGRVRVALTGAGRTTAQTLIDYIRDKAGLASRLKAVVHDEAEAA